MKHSTLCFNRELQREAIRNSNYYDNFISIMKGISNYLDRKQAPFHYNCKLVMNKHSFRLFSYSEDIFRGYKSSKQCKGILPDMFVKLSVRKFLGKQGTPFNTRSFDPILKPRTSFSLSRTRNKIFDVVDCNSNMYTKFMTLTFRDNVTDLCQASKAFNLFLLRFKRLFGFSLKYVRILEFQKRGAVHYHCVVFNSPKLSFYKLKQIWKDFGSVDIKKIDKGVNVSKYVCKYITKDMKDVPVNYRICTFSRGLFQPTYYYFKMEYLREDIFVPFNKYYSYGYFYEGFQQSVSYAFYDLSLDKMGGAPLGGRGGRTQAVGAVGT